MTENRRGELATDKADTSDDKGQLSEKIEKWRSTARTLARDALATDRADEPEQAQYLATIAAMYYAVALDAHTFGNIPELLPDASGSSG